MANLKINLTIDNTNKCIQIDYLKSDNSTVSGTKYIEAPWGEMDATGVGWRFKYWDEESFNREILFADIVNLNGAPIGITTYAAVTALIRTLAVTASPAGSGSVETPSVATYSTSQAITAGAKSVTIVTDSSFTGTIQGATANADATYTFSAQTGNTLGAIAVVRTAGSFTVLKVV